MRKLPLERESERKLILVRERERDREIDRDREKLISENQKTLISRGGGEANLR